MFGYNYRISVILISVVFFFIGEVRSQSFDAGARRLNPNEQSVGSNPFDFSDGEQIDGEEGDAVVDTTKKARLRKPLESYFFNDSIRSQENFLWNIKMRYNKVVIGDIDTLINRFNLDQPFFKHDVGDAYQGNLGGASVPLNYAERVGNQDFAFTNPFYAYVYTAENVPHYNVKNPFTRLDYFQAGQKAERETNFGLIHAQNITPSTGFNITYKSLGTQGMYTNQRAKSNNFSGGFSHTGKQYSAHAGYISNSLDVRDNGGVVDDFFITDTLLDKSRIVPVWLSSDGNNAQGARSVQTNDSFYTIHTYGIPLRGLTDDDFSISDIPSIFFGYSFQFDRWSRKYTDLRQYTDPRSNSLVQEMVNIEGVTPPTHEYYNNWFINPAKTTDSLSESKLSNKLFIQLQPWDRDAIVGTVDAGIGMDIHSYRQFSANDYLTGGTESVRKESYYIYGSIDGRFRKYFDWNGRVHFVPAGYRQGDIEAEASANMSIYIREQPISLSGKLGYSLKEPSYWSEMFISNHFRWLNSFKKENESHMELKLSAPKINAEIAFTESIVGNKIYYGADYKANKSPDIKPVQASDVVSVTGLYVRKDFRLGGFRLNNRVLLQWSTNQEVIPVPLASIHLSYFFEFNVVKDVLRMQIGFDGRFNTKYYAFGFNPAIGQFYNQREKEVGGYPIVDAFAAMKWKRMRILVKMEHINDGLFDNKESFSILHYPLNQRILKFGLSWSFYN